jgi:hypothetical protein
MKSLTIYTAEDGSRFDKEADCLMYESLCARVKLALAPLGREHDIASITYWQHDPADVRQAWAAFIGICREEFGDSLEWLHTKKPEEIHPASYIGRLLSEDGRKCLSHAGYRFHTIDPEGREFDQPFWAYHRGDRSLSEHRRLNP